MFQLVNVSKTYPVGEVSVCAVSNVNLEIKEGELVCLTGQSGSGKSTLLSMLGLINIPTSGEIRFENTVVSNLGDRKLAAIRRNKIGIVFQHFNLHAALTALENVMYPLYMLRDKSAREKSIAALREVGMEEYANRRPKQLSGGQMQRVSIARAFVKSPKLIIADEPTANLDSQNSNLVYGLIRKLNAEKGVTVVIASHDQHLSNSGIRKVHVKDGKVEGV